MNLNVRLLRFTRDSRLALALTVLSGLLAGLLTIGQAWFLSWTVNDVFPEAQTLAQVRSGLQILLAIIAGRAVLAWVTEVSANAVALRVKSDLRGRLFAHILALGPAYTRSERTGELTSTAVEGIEALDAYFSQYLPQLVVAALVPLSILVFVFPLDPLSGIVLLLTAPLIPVFMYLIGKGAEVVTKRQYETLSRLSAHFLDSLQGLTTLKLFGQSKAHTKTIAEVSDRFRDATLSVLRVTFLSALALELIATLSTAIVAVEAGLRLLYYKMTFQQAFFLLVLAPEFYIPLRMLGLRYHAGMAGTSAARRIFEILDTPLENKEWGIERRKKTPPNSMPTIHFRNVTFTYPGESKPALKDVTLTVQPGQHIALVGKTGAGKSTLASLLLRFIQPAEGHISINGRPLDEIPVEDWRTLTAWVPQRPHLFHDTIAANIRVGNPEASDEQVIAAARAAHLHGLAQSLPQGYQTVIGEGGSRLSGGEAQRLALARAFLKNAPILILDEPTSSLDPENEALLEESTRRLMRERTVLTIAHRLNTVFQADQIVVLDSGGVVESGTHQELLARKGTYASMMTRYAGDRTGEVELRSPAGKVPPKSDSVRSLTIASPAPTIRQKLPTFFRLLSFLKGSWGRVALSILLGTLTIGSNIALLGTSSWLIAAAALHPSIANLEVAIVGVRFFGLTRGLFRYLERLVSHDVTFRLLAHLRVWFYEKLEPLAPARLIDYRAGDLLARIVSDIETLENFYVRVVAPPLTALFIMLSVSSFLGSYNPRLAYSLLSFFLGLGLLLPLLTQSLSHRPGADLVSRRANLQALLVDGIQGLADILSFGRAKDYLRQISVAGQTYGRVQRRMACLGGFHAAFATLLTHLGMWTVLILAIPLVNAGQISPVMLGALALITLAAFEAAAPLPLAAQMWSSTHEAAKRLFEIVDASPEVVDGHHDSGFDIRKSPRSTPDLRIRDLAFTYPGQNIPALQNINLDLPPGRSLAIVGPSGAGKSTLVNLLLRFWDYHEGEILLGGEPLFSYAQDKLRERIGVVSQNTYFFNATIRENLRLARPSAGSAEIESAARGAQIHDFISGLPKGYDTFIGEQGWRLSGGERQRLAIARLLLKDASILILDEPAANLDPLTERQVLEALYCFMRGHTTLLITHRLVGLERFDEILVLEQGKIVERGTHKELLDHNGLYGRMWEFQNRILAA